MQNMNPVVKAVLTAVVMVPVLFGIDYVADVFIKGIAFSPSWITIIGFSIFAGVLTYVGPDAAQRKQNRQNLKDSFTKKR